MTDESNELMQVIKGLTITAFDSSIPVSVSYAVSYGGLNYLATRLPWPANRRTIP